MKGESRTSLSPKANRRERQERAAEKRREIQRQLLDEVLRVLRAGREPREAFEAGDVLLNRMVRATPQEKALIIQAGEELTDSLDARFKEAQVTDDR